MTRLFRSLCFLIALTLPLGASAQNRVTIAEDVKLIVFRHADRTGSETALNATGIARAAALPAALAGQRIDAIFSPEIDRNLDTVAPLAAERGVSIQNIGPFKMPDTLAGVASGQTVVWVGNKDNLRRLWLRAGIPGDPPLVYGELFIVTFAGRLPAQVEQNHFGP